MDDRTYIRLHDGMPDHPKVIGLSHAAFRLYVESMCWCSRYLTDGIVPAAAIRRMTGYSPMALRELTAAGLIEDQEAPGWVIHDYTEHQRTADAVALLRKAKREAAAAGNHERWHVARRLPDPTCELCAITDVSQVRSLTDRTTESQMRSGCDPKPSQETETDTEGKNKTIAQPGSDDDPDFTAFWSAYPRKVGKGQARKAWRAAVAGRRVNPKELIAASERFGSDCRSRGTEAQFIPHPATWLNGERYADEASQDADPDEDFWER